MKWDVLCVLLLIVGCEKAAVDGTPGSAPGNAVQKSAASADAGWSEKLVDLDGRELKFEGEAGTKAVAFVFILADCPICNAYVPELNRLHAAFASRGVWLVLVHADATVAADKAREHAREFALQMPVVLDPKHDLVNKAGATIAPEAAVFSPAGELLYRGRIDNQYAGLGKRRAVVTAHDLQDALEAVLAGKPIPEPRTVAIGCPIPEPAEPAHGD
jgi:peroxiredoxin